MKIKKECEECNKKFNEIFFLKGKMYCRRCYLKNCKNKMIYVGPMMKNYLDKKFVEIYRKVYKE